MNEILQLLRENNMMLRFICNYIISKEQIQDVKDFLNNVAVEAARDLYLSQSNIVNCCNGGYWRDNHTKFIKTNKVKQYIFKYKDEVN